VVDPALRLREELARLEVRQEVDEPDVGAQALDLGDGGPHGSLVGAARGEEPPERRLGLEELGALRTRLGEHRVHQLARLRLLVRGELQALPELEHVHRPWVAVLVGCEGHAKPRPSPATFSNSVKHACAA
jgi:hypothetical protein